jgi:hypothetical protein
MTLRKGVYWKLKEKALDRNVWRTRFGRIYGPVLRQTKEYSNSPVPNYKGIEKYVLADVKLHSMRS